MPNTITLSIDFTVFEKFEEILYFQKPIIYES
jgi:hypothetical protein